MTVRVREISSEDRALWASLRHALWPSESVAEHGRWIGAQGGSDYWGFVAEESSAAIGFAEIALRKYANGCDSSPVPFLEGIWVAEAHRRQGVAQALLAHIEAILIVKGFRELGSDALIDNPVSHAAHRGLGFSETERVVYFRKTLG